MYRERQRCVYIYIYIYAYDKHAAGISGARQRVELPPPEAPNQGRRLHRRGEPGNPNTNVHNNSSSTFTSTNNHANTNNGDFIVEASREDTERWRHWWLILCCVAVLCSCSLPCVDRSAGHSVRKTRHINSKPLGYGGIRTLPSRASGLQSTPQGSSIRTEKTPTNMSALQLSVAGARRLVADLLL